MSSFSSNESNEQTPATTSQPDNSCLDITSKQTGPMLEDFPFDSSNPFATPFCASDLVLVVEGKKLHVHRPILSLYSSYFRAMLDSHFAEADAKEIELKGSEVVEMKYNAMVKFLVHLYPAHSFKGITDDSSLVDLFPLAEYFQCKHIRTKCEAYIRQQLELIGPLSSMDSTKVSATSALLYLRLCVKYELKQFIETLLKLLSRKSLQNIVNHEHFKCLTPEKQRDVLHRRAEFVEERLDQQVHEVQMYISYGRCDIGRECDKCRERFQHGCIICSKCCRQFNGTLKDSQSD